MPCLQVVASADVFGIYQEGVQQHLDDAFANKAAPDTSPQFPLATPGPFNNSALAPPHPTSVPEPPVSQPHPQPQPQLASESTEQLASVSVADPQMQDPAAPAAAAAPAAEHTAAELPEGPAQDAAAATAADGIPTAIVPTDHSVVVEAVTAPAASENKADGNKYFPCCLHCFLKLQHVAHKDKKLSVHVCTCLAQGTWLFMLLPPVMCLALTFHLCVQGLLREQQHQHCSMVQQPHCLLTRPRQLIRPLSCPPQPRCRWRLPYRRTPSWFSGRCASFLCGHQRQQLALT